MPGQKHSWFEGIHTQIYSCYHICIFQCFFLAVDNHRGRSVLHTCNICPLKKKVVKSQYYLPKCRSLRCVVCLKLVLNALDRTFQTGTAHWVILAIKRHVASGKHSCTRTVGAAWLCGAALEGWSAARGLGSSWLGSSCCRALVMATRTHSLLSFVLCETS